MYFPQEVDSPLAIITTKDVLKFGTVLIVGFLVLTYVYTSLGFFENVPNQFGHERIGSQLDNSTLLVRNMAITISHRLQAV